MCSFNTLILLVGSFDL